MVLVHDDLLLNDTDELKGASKNLSF
ncbi:hypothetical protein NTG1052_80041 [Candidatus Nitrotoga sp. 1052]|nr:hypothetical protein NTG1052_80041 [Candidatus Nitrotoga sp. 1052]